jgi:hypothetical protein
LRVNFGAAPAGPEGVAQRCRRLFCELNPLSSLKKIHSRGIASQGMAPESGRWHMGCIIQVTGDFVCKCGLNF